jgi:hypothetical protein
MPIKKLAEHLKRNDWSGNDWKSRSRRMLFHHEVTRFTSEFRENFVTLIISSLGLVVALSWNNFWNAWISSLPMESTLPYKMMVAFSMTILAVFLTYFLSKLKKRS